MSPTSDTRRYETISVSGYGLLIASVGVLVLILLAAAGMYGLLQLTTTQTAASDSKTDSLATSGELSAVLSAATQADELHRLREAEDAILSSYGWVDQEKGTARIPIERAMEIFVARQQSQRSQPPQSSSDEAP